MFEVAARVAERPIHAHGVLFGCPELVGAHHDRGEAVVLRLDLFEHRDGVATACHHVIRAPGLAREHEHDRKGGRVRNLRGRR